MVGNVTLVSDDQQSDLELLAWLNDTLQSGFINVEQTCSAKVPDQIKKNADIKAETRSFKHFHCSQATQHFIKKYCPTASALTRKKILDQKYPKNIAALCNQTPYCLYMYHGVELSEDQKAIVILAGYFDQNAGKSKVRLLDVVQETNSEFPNCIVKTLKMYQIPLANLASFYSNAPNLTELTSDLKNLNSGTLVLCNLNGIADKACCSGIKAIKHLEQIPDLIKEVQQHFPSLPSSLKEQLCDMEKVNTSSLLCNCLILRTAVHKIALAWSDLVQYFSGQDANSSTRPICCLLNDKSLRLCFLFLSHALQPLCQFQESLNQDKDASEVLHNARNLLHLFVSSYLHPHAAKLFLRRENASPSKAMMDNLPRDEIKIGKLAATYLCRNDSELADCSDLFYKSAVSFYAAVTSSIVSCLPLPDSALKTMVAVLSPEGKLEVSGKTVADLGVHLGVCTSAEEISLLTDEFLEYQFTEREVTNPIRQLLDQYWKEELRIMGKMSHFRKLILRLLTLPKTLNMEKVFAQLFESVDLCMESSQEEMEISEHTAHNGDVTEGPSASSHTLRPKTKKRSKSDIIDLTEVDDVTPMEINTSVSDPGVKKKNQESILVDDDDDDDVIWTDTSYSKDEKAFTAGEMVWGQMESCCPLRPGLVREWIGEKPRKSMCRVEWFVNGMMTKVHTASLQPFSAFAQCFCPNAFATMTLYKEAIFHSLQVAAERAGKSFNLESDCKDELLKVMLNWAFGGFMPSGPNALKPRSKEDECLKLLNGNSEKVDTMLLEEPQELEEKSGDDVPVDLNKMSIDLQNSQMDLTDQDSIQTLSYPKEKQSPVQTVEKCSLSVCETVTTEHPSPPPSQIKDQSSSDKVQDYNRQQMVHMVLVKGKNIEDFCLSCGTARIEIFHPLFEGSLCLKCKDNFTETLYRYDEDGYQSYCTVCCAGLEVILCGHDSCCRSYCVDCLNTLIGQGTVDKLKDMDPWICYLCAPESSSGALRPRHDWSIRVQEFFANNSAMEFEPHRVYPSIPANLRRPIRVLSLFDGISTGYLVLRDLGFKVEKYVASEVDDESITVSMVNHDGKITEVDDVRRITKQHIEDWGPFDLLIGGSPCNDLSIVNPARKGLFEGTGRLFFDFYRLLNIMKPKDDDPRPFFWLFENVVFMNNRDKADICRFLECNPVLVDAVKVSPAHRARYFWGNLPGMNRPIVASQNDKLTLQECLDPGRTAKYVKVRTITTRTNSLKQGSADQHFPVSMNGKDDGLWVTELEKIFGFPKHYTDVKNMGRMQRQKVTAILTQEIEDFPVPWHSAGIVMLKSFPPTSLSPKCCAVN
ncbi:DNA (cytosine-5-)-methyltransferase beta, duplicate b.3 [Trichomycterus rosablanca]|uniref:DNA (cytosine-5-)-methyltransferase beta, duplicate b.3 n=1 Tax=Trichomycterus rosablanca TaxID=2290929 RepID=UPI002F35AF01